MAAAGISSPTPAEDDPGSNFMRGEGLPFDVRLAHFRNRERRLMTIFDPEKEDFDLWKFCVIACDYGTVVLRNKFFWFLLVVFYCVPLLGCTLVDGASSHQDWQAISVQRQLSEDLGGLDDGDGSDLSQSQAAAASVLNVTAAAMSNGICYGPERWTYKNHFPTMMTGFTTFLLVFFTSHNYGRQVWAAARAPRRPRHHASTHLTSRLPPTTCAQRQLFEKMIDLRTSLSAVVVLGVATCGNRPRPESTVRILEIWRCANLINLCARHLATSATSTTSSLSVPFPPISCRACVLIQRWPDRHTPATQALIPRYGPRPLLARGFRHPHRRGIRRPSAWRHATRGGGEAPQEPHTARGRGRGRLHE